MVEKMLNIIQCTDREKVLYALGRLEGTAADWWDAYTAVDDTPNTITWQEFRSKFREQHIPKGLMKLKKQEFLALKQGAISVSEYRDKFIQLSCYARAEVADDEEKQDHFRDGLIGPIKYQLWCTPLKTSRRWWTMPSWWSMLAGRWVSRSGNLSHQGSSTTTHGLVSCPCKEHFSALEDRVSTTGRINTSAPISTTSSSSKLSMLVSQCSAPASCRIARIPLLEHL
jgi:hypothetical protein